MKLYSERNETVYVTVTEEWYGGHDDATRPTPVRVFTEEEDARAFASSYGKRYNVDVIVIPSVECHIDDHCDDGTFQLSNAIPRQ